MEKKCKICQIVKPVETGFLQSSSYITDDGTIKFYYRGECIDCNNNKRRGQNNEYCKEYRNRPEIQIKRSEYRKKKRKELAYKEHQRYHEKNRYHNDELYRLKKCLRSRIKRALESKRWAKQNKTEEYLGCSYEELKKHIEHQFTSQMTWENHGEYWEIEHTKALGLAQTVEEMYKLTHYTNLRPLEIQEHRDKLKYDMQEIILRKKDNK